LKKNKVMKNILILISLMFFSNAYCQKYTLLEVNSSWNKKAVIEDVDGVEHIFAILEDQKPSFREKIKTVPTVILYMDNNAIAQWDGGISMKLVLKREDILKAIEESKKYKK